MLGQLLYTHNKGEKKAIELWESVLKNKEAYSEVAEKASDRLSEAYYREAIAAEGRGQNSRPWISKIEKLAKYNTKTKLAEAFGASLMLGLWFREHGKPNEAKKCCFANVMSALDLLSNPDSDVKGKYAWTNLGAALIHAGDMANAAAAYAPEMETFGYLDETRLRSEMEIIEAEKTEIIDTSRSEEDESDRKEQAGEILPALKDMNIKTGTSKAQAEDLKPETNTSEDGIESQLGELTKVITKVVKPAHPPVVDRFPDAPALPGNTSWYCDGLCRRKISAWKELYICEICLDSICFCELCIELIKTDKLPFKVCGYDHRFYKAFPVAKGLGTTADGKLGVGAGKDAEDLDTFVTRVRREWTDAISA